MSNKKLIPFGKIIMLKFRPHHFLCANGFQGKGYSDVFVENFREIVTQLRAPEGSDTLIQVIEETDSICAPCPNKQGALCTTQEKIAAIDKAHAEVLGLQAGDVISWGEAKYRIRSQMSLEKFHQSCHLCSWKASGICEQALKQLISNN